MVCNFELNYLAFQSQGKVFIKVLKDLRTNFFRNPFTAKLNVVVINKM